jgi:hypothetical protein
MKTCAISGVAGGANLLNLQQQRIAITINRN